MTAKLILSIEMQAQAEDANGWWIANRDRAPTLFADELAEALTLVEHQPDAGRPVPRRAHSNLRRVELRKTRYFLLYEHDSAAGTVFVHAIWSALRKRRPRLAKR